MRDGTDEDLPRIGLMAEARGDVHDRPDAHLLAGPLRRREVDDRLTGLDADANVKPDVRAATSARPSAGRLSGTKGAGGVVLVRHGRTEERIDLVTDVLLDGAALPLDEPAELAERRGERGLQPLCPKT